LKELPVKYSAFPVLFAALALSPSAGADGQPIPANVALLKQLRPIFLPGSPEESVSVYYVGTVGKGKHPQSCLIDAKLDVNRDEDGESMGGKGMSVWITAGSRKEARRASFGLWDRDTVEWEDAVTTKTEIVSSKTPAPGQIQAQFRVTTSDAPTEPIDHTIKVTARDGKIDAVVRVVDSLNVSSHQAACYGAVPFDRSNGQHRLLEIIDSGQDDFYFKSRTWKGKTPSGAPCTYVNRNPRNAFWISFRLASPDYDKKAVGVAFGPSSDQVSATEGKVPHGNKKIDALKVSYVTPGGTPTTVQSSFTADADNVESFSLAVTRDGKTYSCLGMKQEH
jgi:hypothetical protein